ncbi:nucleoside-triphosphatase [Methanocaldococcus sp. 10A]
MHHRLKQSFLATIYCKKFSNVVNEVIKSNKPLLATLHRNWVNKFKDKGDIYTLTVENRDELFEKILNKVLNELK